MAVAAIVAGCSSEDSAQMQEPAGKPAASELQQLVFGTAGTRAHWEDGDTKLTFAWDADNVGTELVCAIASEGAFAPGYKVTGNEVGEAEYASYLTIAPNVEDTGLATFTTVNSFHKDLSLVGQTIHAVTPVGNDKVTSTASSFSVEMEMPNTFTQIASGDLGHLKPDMQMYATGIVAAGNTDLTFNHIPATLGFNIVNSGSSAVIVKSVTIDAVEASNGVIATALSSSAATYSAASGLAYAAGETHSAVTTKLGSDAGVSIEAGSNYLAYALVLPLAADEALQDAYLRVRVTTDKGTYTLYTLSGEQLKTKTEAENYNWQSGQFYGFKLTIPELEETCALPKGSTFNSALSTALTETSCTKVRFIAGSNKKTLETTFASIENAYAIANGDWLEIHTPAKVIKANSDCAEMFYTLNTLTAIDFGCNFNTANVTSMYRFFRDCQGLTVLDLNTFNTANATNISSMFYNCTSLLTLDLSNFNTEKVTTMKEMFRQATSLTTVNVSSFNTTQVSDMTYMFGKCNLMQELDLTNFSFESMPTVENFLYQVAYSTSSKPIPVYVTKEGYDYLTTNISGVESGNYAKRIKLVNEEGIKWSEIIAEEEGTAIE